MAAHNVDKSNIMSAAVQQHLNQWLEAGLVDGLTVERIRAWEAAHDTPRLRWPIWVALAFGTILLAAGLLLFISAHWDQLSPANRLSIVLAALGAFHLAGAAASTRFPALSIALHAGGTAALGGAIALTGQIFHLSEHWPGGILLWAAGAACGWAILRQWPQALLTAILVPAWLGSEWFDHVRRLAPDSSYQPAWAGLLALSLVYLGAAHRRGNSAERRSLAWLGGLALLPFGAACAVTQTRALDEPWSLAAWAVAFLMPLVLSFALRGSECLWSGLAVAWTAALVLIRALPSDVVVYLWIAAGAAALVWWGLRESRAERIHLGIAAFALNVLVFYFSNVMDKLERSVSLIGFGLLFLGGGWLLEQTRRQLMAQLAENEEDAK